MRTMIIAFALAAGMNVLPQNHTFKRGELVRVREVTRPAVLKIVGLPDEIVQVDASGVYADDAPLPGFSQEFLKRNKWDRQIVPFGHYFVIGEERIGGEVHEYLGIHPEETIERANAK